MVVDLRTERWYWRGTYEQDVQSALLRTVGEGSVVYDLGAHAGFLALLAQRLAGPSGFVLAAEANAGLAERLARNLSLNSGARAEVVVAAIGDRPGVGTLVPAATTYELRLDRAEGDAELGTDVTSVDALVAGGRPEPDVIKVDVEGAELAMLVGAAKTLERKQPIVICELHRWGRPLEVMAMLSDAGYALSSVIDERPITTDDVQAELTRIAATRIFARAQG
jgi:FkbM family methyltransferase